MGQAVPKEETMTETSFRLTVNGTPAEAEHPLSDGDTIRWGSRTDALVSRVEIG